VRDDLEFDRDQNLKCLTVRFGSIDPPTRSYQASQSGARLLPTGISDHRYSVRDRSGYHPHGPRAYDRNQVHAGRGCLFHSVPGLARYARRTHRCPLVQSTAAAARHCTWGQSSDVQLMLGGISGLIAQGVFTVPGN